MAGREIVRGIPKERKESMLDHLADEIWTLPHDFKMMGIDIGTRTTLVRLADGGLFLHAPGHLVPEAIDAINELGPVRCIVAPNDFHHLFIGEAAALWPEAKVFVSPGLPSKRSDLPDHEILGDTPSEDWKADLDQVWMRGAPRVNEIVFFHRLSRTLVVTDLAFNVPDPGSFLLRLFMRINGSFDRFATSRLMKSMYSDRAAARVSAEKILNWDFDRLVLCHGNVVEQGAKALLESESAWLLKA
jgi:hypothetical protein